jgi:four helix bundle protein
VVKLCRQIEQDAIRKPIISQLVRSATNIGANYCEANAASSRKDFKNKIHICKKEAQETKYWLRILATCAPDMADSLRILWKEAQELTLIFGKIISSLKIKQIEIDSKLKIGN